MAEIESKAFPLPFDRVFSAAGWMLAATLLVASVSRSLALDSHPIGMWLTYPPRSVLAVTAGLTALLYAWRRRKTLATILMALSLLFAVQASHAFGLTDSGTPAAAATHDLNLLAFNIHNNASAIAAIQQTCEQHNVDVVMFQEVESTECRQQLEQYFDEFQFFWPDHSLAFEYSNEGAFTCVTGVRRELLATTSPPEIQTGVTGYRTYAVSVPLLLDGKQQACWFVNVHSTKAFYVAKGLSGVFSKMAWKANRHRTEKLRLAKWLQQHQQSPVVVAGDFNAPAESFNLTFDNIQSAHAVAGSGSNLTFPQVLPIWGIDHTLGNQRIQFHDYEILSLPYSDHCAQLASFSLE